MEVPAEVIRQLRVPLATHERALREGLGRVLTARVFPAHPRFKGRTPPQLVEADALRAIRVVYVYSHFVPIACGMSAAGGWKCGSLPLLDVRGHLFDRNVEDGFLESFAAPKRLEAAQVLGATETDLIERWVREAWSQVRTSAPDLSGFVSEHDGGPMTNLDTGERVRNEKALGLGYL
jgi:hypothetical protein